MNIHGVISLGIGHRVDYEIRCTFRKNGQGQTRTEVLNLHPDSVPNLPDKQILKNAFRDEKAPKNYNISKQNITLYLFGYLDKL